MMQPTTFILAADLTRRYAQSAMPGAPVLPDNSRPRSREPGGVRPVRSGTAAVLRRLADRLDAPAVPA